MPPFCERHQRYHQTRPHRERGQTFTACPVCEPEAFAPAPTQETPR